MDDRIAEHLRSLDATPVGPPPATLLRALSAEAPEIRARRRSRLRTRFGIASAVLAALVAASFTPPGRAATGWVAELAGIGEPPTLDQPRQTLGAGVVIDNGTLSDGTPYEAVARIIDLSEFGPGSRSGGQADGSAEGSREERTQDICFGIDFPGSPKAEQDSFCAGREATRGDDPPFTTYGLLGVPGGEPDGPRIYFGIVEDPTVAEVRVVREDRRRGRTPLPAKLIPIERTLLERVGREDPVRILISPFDESVVAAGDRGETQVYAIGLDGSGVEIGRATAFDNARVGRARATNQLSRAAIVKRLRELRRTEDIPEMDICAGPFDGGIPLRLLYQLCAPESRTDLGPSSRLEGPDK